jgi:hypothetical protein
VDVPLPVSTATSTVSVPETNIANPSFLISQDTAFSFSATKINAYTGTIKLGPLSTSTGFTALLIAGASAFYDNDPAVSGDVGNFTACYGAGGAWTAGNPGGGKSCGTNVGSVVVSFSGVQLTATFTANGFIRDYQVNVDCALATQPLPAAMDINVNPLCSKSAT